jgi:hypothetical protein
MDVSILTPSGRDEPLIFYTQLSSGIVLALEVLIFYTLLFINLLSPFGKRLEIKD